MLNSDNLTNNARKRTQGVRAGHASLHPRARSLRTPLQQEIECRFVETLIGRDYPTAFRRLSGASCASKHGIRKLMKSKSTKSASVASVVPKSGFLTFVIKQLREVLPPTPAPCKRGCKNQNLSVRLPSGYPKPTSETWLGEDPK